MWRVIKIFLGIFLVMAIAILGLLLIKKPQKPEIVELKKETNVTPSTFEKPFFETINPPTGSKPLLEPIITTTTEEISTISQETTSTETEYFEEPEHKEIIIIAKEFYFNPSEITISSTTPVSIIFKNEANIPFDLKISNEDFSIKTDLISPGSEAKLEIKFPKPGIYEFYTTISIGQEKGMKGKIIVK